MTDPFQQQPGFGGPQYGPPGTGPALPPGYGAQGQPSYPAQPNYSAPLPVAMPVAAPRQPGFLLAIGDIGISEGLVTTPAGTLPLRGAVWTATDMSQSSESTPAYAVVLAILFLPMCFLGLLFLLIKQKSITGYVQVTVTSAGRYHSTLIAAQNESTFPMVMQQVNYARSVSAM
ncbi:hypothetical protein [Nocardia sp. NBC_00511]|uniref:hypothetical protein n=1 Tax=Nocardia sp. NBC_00511 TaxID=2903591 RepID=UPI0030E24E53